MDKENNSMEVTFQVFDVDYTFLKDLKKPLIRIFGKTEDGKDVCAVFSNYYPYFYINHTNEKVLEKFKNLILKYEIVEKFLPKGYSNEKVKLLKVYLKNPADVPKVRDEINIETFEADILFKYRFMADFEIKAMNWIKVKGKPLNTEISDSEIKLEIEKIENVDIEKDANFKYLFLDIETLSSESEPNPEKDPIIIISLFFYPAFNNKNTLVLISKNSRNLDKDVLTFENENEMLKKFLEIVKDFNPDFIVGYNISEFDFPYLVKRMKVLKIGRNIGKASDKPALSKQLSEKRHKNQIVGRVIVDIYKIIKEFSKRGFFQGLKRFDLGTVSKALINDEKIDIPHSKIPEYWNKDLKKLIEYSRKDAELTFKLFMSYKLLDKFIALSKVSGLLLQDVLDGGEASKIEIILLREFNKKDFVLPNKPSKEEIKRREKDKEARGLEGGLVLEPEIGFHDNCIVYLDFASMYPNIIISYNICPTTIVLNEKYNNLEMKTVPYGSKFVTKNIREGIYPKILRELIESRNKIKSLLKKEKDEKRKEYLDGIQEALKRIANAFYGYTGFVSGRLYILEIANSITSVGRSLIKEMKNLIETQTNYKVIYGDTDSIMVKLDTKDIEVAQKKALELENLVNDKYENLKMKLEKIFKTLLITHKKRYAGLAYEDGKEQIITKGIETVRRDWCDLVTETLMNVLEIILKEKNIEKAVNYFKKVVDDLKNGKISLEKLTITKSISKKIDEYKGIQPHIELIKKMRERGEANLPGVGDRVGFVVVKGTDLVSKRVEDPKYVIEKGLEIDINYYIDAQLLPPLERIFLAIGAETTALKDIGKQTRLFEIGNNNNNKHYEIKEFLNGFEKVICKKCGRNYNRVTLSSKCLECNSELYFFKNNSISKKVFLA